MVEALKQAVVFGLTFPLTECIEGGQHSVPVLAAYSRLADKLLQPVPPLSDSKCFVVDDVQ